MTHRLAAAGLACGLFAAPIALAQPIVEIFPNLPHAASNTIPWGQASGNTGIVVHQVFASTLFSAIAGPGETVEISRLAFAPTSSSGSFNADVVLRLGYTNAIPGQTNTAGGLQLPDLAGGGIPNASGPMHVFYDAPTFHSISGAGPESFTFIFEGTPFVYDPSLGNLLFEIVTSNQTSGFAVSRSAGSEQASRVYHRLNGTTSLGTTQAHRTEFTITIGGSGVCYANCDSSTVQPVLNVDDFTCFINEFAAAQSLPHEQQVAHYSNCDNSTTAPVLNVDDFTCFINAFAAGCP